jgi:UMF1 family MFS transporter
MQKNNPKTLWAWCMYDWANSTYSLTITSAIFPTYFIAIAVNSAGKEQIDFLFWQDMPSSAVYAFIYSFASLLIAVINPLIGSVADATGKQKAFMRFFCYLGVLSCFLLFFSTTAYLHFTMCVFIVSSIAYSCSIVFCNSLLPVIATPDKFEEVSARGFALGYMGGVVMLAINILMIQLPTWFGFTPEMIRQNLPVRVSFVLVGVWWLVFAEWAFAYLPSRGVPTSLPTAGKRNIFTQGYVELIKAGKALLGVGKLRTFIFSFFFYNMGLMTIMGLATVFGKEEMKLPQADLIQIVLLLQLVGAGGAWFFGYLSRKIGNLPALQIGVFLWILVCIYAYTITTRIEFYILAICVGWIMGGLQALSRAGFARLLPTDTPESASFFSFYDTTDKIGTVLGTFLYGLIHTLTGSMRYSILVLTVFFAIGLVGLFVLQGIVKREKQA